MPESSTVTIPELLALARAASRAARSRAPRAGTRAAAVAIDPKLVEKLASSAVGPLPLLPPDPRMKASPLPVSAKSSPAPAKAAAPAPRTRRSARSVDAGSAVRAGSRAARAAGSSRAAGRVRRRRPDRCGSPGGSLERIGAGHGAGGCGGAGSSVGSGAGGGVEPASEVAAGPGDDHGRRSRSGSPPLRGRERCPCRERGDADDRDEQRADRVKRRRHSMLALPGSGSRKKPTREEPPPLRALLWRGRPC